VGGADTRRRSRCVGELFLRYERDVFTQAYRLLNNRGETEDAAQEAFLRHMQPRSL